MKARFIAVLSCALLPATAYLAAAQQPVSKPPPMPPSPAALSVPNPFAGSVPAALTVPNPLAGLQPGPRDLYRSPDGSDRFHHLSAYPPRPTTLPGHYFPGPYYYPYINNFYPFAVPQSYPPAPVYVPLRGGLVLESLPDTAQVYVDGFYVGLVEEFGLRGRALDLAAGPHQVELRAPGHETLNFSVMIAANETLRYRGDMQALASSVPAPPRAAEQPGSPKSFYVIPNCYAGDKPPKAALRPGCDPKNVQTRK
jgi:PEGA domain